MNNTKESCCEKCREWPPHIGSCPCHKKDAVDTTPQSNTEAEDWVKEIYQIAMSDEYAADCVKTVRSLLYAATLKGREAERNKVYEGMREEMFADGNCSMKEAFERYCARQDTTRDEGV